MATAHVSSGTISTLFKSRNILLQLLARQGMDVSNYTDYGVAEVQTMYANNQLDMLLTTEKDVHPTRKVYVKYYLAKTLRRENINHMIDDLFYLEQALQPTDTLIIVMKQEVNDTVINILNEEVLKKYNIIDTKQMPSISRYDPVALAIGLRPGQICRITRSSKTSVTSIYYRYCVTN